MSSRSGGKLSTTTKRVDVARVVDLLEVEGTVLRRADFRYGNFGSSLGGARSAFSTRSILGDRPFS